MRSGIRDDNEGSDDRLKYKEDRQATGSWRGQGKNTHTYTSHTHTHTHSHSWVGLFFFYSA